MLDSRLQKYACPLITGEITDISGWYVCILGLNLLVFNTNVLSLCEKRRKTLIMYFFCSLILMFNIGFLSMDYKMFV
jgi:hypothetical protein